MYQEEQSALDEIIAYKGTAFTVPPSATVRKGMFDKLDSQFDLEVQGQRQTDKFNLVVSKTDLPTGIARDSTVTINGATYKQRGNPTEDEISFSYVLTRNAA